MALAKKEQVDFVVLAGDIFDGSANDSRSAAFFNGQLRELDPIPVFIVRGNHDAETVLTKSQLLTPPKNAHIFSSKKPETMKLGDLRVAIHGQSYKTKAVMDDLSAGYPEREPGYTNIGVLHTSLAGYAEHAPYAPCSIDALVAKGYDYWALGHVHVAQIVRAEEPVILFPGNIQGRHVKETGAKGCYIVRAEGSRLVPTFHPLDSVRWFNDEIDVSAADNLDSAMALAMEHVEGLQAAQGERVLCVRLTFVGATAVHHELMADRDVHEVNLRSQLAGTAWIERLRIRTTPVIDLKAVKERDDVPGALFRAIDALQDDPGNPLILDALKSLKEKIPADIVDTYGTRLTSDEFVHEALAGAQRVLLGLMSQA